MKGEYVQHFTHTPSKINKNSLRLINFEIKLLLPFLILWLYLIVKGLPIVKPDIGSLLFAWNHYVNPLVFALLAQALLTVFFRKSRPELNKVNTAIIFLYIPFIAIVVFLHFNFKAWTPLINPTTYDSLYHSIDTLLPFTNWLSSICYFLGPNNIAAYLYHNLFVLMFLLSFIFHSSFDSFLNFRKVVMGTCLILLFGGVSYWIMPAVGPFLFEQSKLAGFSQYQEYMYSLYNSFIATRIVPSGYFINAPAAMPSLHIANSFFFLITAKRSLPYLAALYAPIFVFIIIVAVGSGWHYTIDLPFGIILSLLALYIVDKTYTN